MDYEDTLRRNKLIDSLYGKSKSSNTQHGQARSSFLNELKIGRDLREEYANSAGIQLKDIIRQELSPSISYTAPSSKQVSTDEPPIEPMGTGRGDIDLARLPIYKALLDDLKNSK